MAEQKVSKLLRSLGARRANPIIYAAGVNRAIALDVPIEFVPGEVSRLIPPVLRAIKLNDEDFRALLAESDIGITGDRYHPPQEVTITIPYARDASSRGGIPLTELAAASVIVWETAVRTAATMGDTLAVAQRLPPPEAYVRVGSASFSFGGGSLIAAGVAFVVAAYSSILPFDAAKLALYGGAFLSSLGVVDMAINWYRVVSEAAKLNSEEALNEAQTRLTEVQIERARRDLQPASNLVAPEIVVSESRRFGLDAAIGTHLLNQVLPAYAELSHEHSGIRASPASSRGASA